MIELVGCIDLGSSKVTALIAEASPEGVKILATGSAVNNGLRQGVVVDINAAATALSEAISIAEEGAGVKLDSVVVNISGSHINSRLSHGMSRIESGDVNASDVQNAMNAACAIELGEGNKAIHALPLQYLIDQQPGVMKPMGLAGRRLEVDALLISADPNACRNIERCVQHSDLSVQGYVVSSLAAGKVVLNEDEKELGTAVIDIGAGTTDIAVYLATTARMVGVVSMGGSNVTSDIVKVLRTPAEQAEQIKLKYACALVDLVSDNDVIQVPSAMGNEPRNMGRAALSKVVEARYREIFTEVKAQLNAASFDTSDFTSIVLTGGASGAEGLAELAEEVFHCSTRIGQPDIHRFGSLLSDLSSSCLCGILDYARTHGHDSLTFQNQTITEIRKPSVFGSALAWFKENF